MKSTLSKSHSWYVLYTLPNYERKVHLSLIKKKIPCFLPLQRVIREWSDRKKTVEVPLFPNYIFIKTPEKERFSVLNIHGAKSYINVGGRPVSLSENEMNNIKMMITGPEVSIERDFKVGDIVKISSGPFLGIKGFLFERRGKNRFGVKIESINQILSIEVNPTWLERVN